MTELAGRQREDLSIDQQLALRTAAARLGEEFAGGLRRRDDRAVPALQLRPVRHRQHGTELPAPAGRAVRPPAPAPRWPGSRATPTTAARSCCSSASTTPAGARWRSASSSTSPATRRSLGPAAPSPASRSTRPRSPRWPSAASTSPASTRSRGPTRWSAPRTSSSRWAAATPARSSPASGTRTGILDDPAGQDVDARPADPRRDRTSRPRSARRARPSPPRTWAASERRRAPLWRRVVAEGVGTGLLVTVVVGSGIAAAALSPDDVGLQLLRERVRDGARSRRTDPDVRTGVRRALQPGRSRSSTGGSGNEPVPA